jgi:hypothetical protein
MLIIQRQGGKHNGAFAHFPDLASFLLGITFKEAIGTVTGEEVVLFTLAASPILRDFKKN